MYIDMYIYICYIYICINMYICTHTYKHVDALIQVSMCISKQRSTEASILRNKPTDN